MNCPKNNTKLSTCLMTTLILVFFCACNDQTEAENLETDQTHAQNMNSSSSQEPINQEEDGNSDSKDPKGEKLKKSFFPETPAGTPVVETMSPQNRNGKEEIVGNKDASNSEKEKDSLSPQNENSDIEKKERGTPHRGKDQTDVSLAADHLSKEDGTKTAVRNQEKPSVSVNEAFPREKLKLVGFDNKANLHPFQENLISVFARGDRFPRSREITLPPFYTTWGEERTKLIKNTTDILEMILDFESENEPKLIAKYTYNKYNYGKTPESTDYTFELPMSVEELGGSRIHLKFSDPTTNENPIHAFLLEKFGNNFGNSEFVVNCWKGVLNGEYSFSSEQSDPQGQKKIRLTKGQPHHGTTTLIFIPYSSQSNTSDLEGNATSQ